MTVKVALTAADRDFFARMAQVTYMNPFDPERQRILAELAGQGARAPEEAINAVFHEVDARIASLDH